MLNFRMIYQYLNLSLKSHLYLESYRLVCKRKKPAFALQNLQFLIYSSVFGTNESNSDKQYYIFFKWLRRSRATKQFSGLYKASFSACLLFLFVLSWSVGVFMTVFFFFHERQTNPTDIQKHCDLCS